MPDGKFDPMIPRVTTFGTVGMTPRIEPKRPIVAVPELPLSSLDKPSCPKGRSFTFSSEARFGSAGSARSTATTRDIGPGSYNISNPVAATHGTIAKSVPHANFRMEHGHVVYCSARENNTPGVGHYESSAAPQSARVPGAFFPRASRGIERKEEPYRTLSYDVADAIKATYTKANSGAISKVSREVPVNVKGGFLTFRSQGTNPDLVPAVGSYTGDTTKLTLTKGVSISKTPRMPPSGKKATDSSAPMYDTAQFDTIASRVTGNKKIGRFLEQRRDVTLSLKNGHLIYCSAQNASSLLPGVGTYDITEKPRPPPIRRSTSPSKPARSEWIQTSLRVYQESQRNLGPGTYHIDAISPFEKRSFNVKLRKGAQM